MRDERYYQRLNQIREKYGYLGDVNPEHQLKRMAEKRDFVPPTSHQPHRLQQYHDVYQVAPKQQQNQNVINTLLQARRAKENNSTPAQNYQRQSTTQRSYRQTQTNNPRFPLQKRQAPNIPNYPSQFITTSHSASKDSSPIKRLQIDLSHQNTPVRQYNHNTQRPKVTQVGSTRSNYRTQMGNITDRTSKLPYDTVIDEITRNPQVNVNQTSIPDRNSNSTPRQPRQLKNMVQTLYNNKEQEDYSDKYNASLNNIDKLQERIQAMLNKPKK